MNHYKTRFPRQYLYAVISIFFFAACSNQKQQVTISSDLENPKIEFAVDEIKASFVERGVEVLLVESTSADIVFLIQPENTELKPEGFSIKKEGKKIIVIGADNAGAMYGGLELAEQISLYGLNGITEATQNPYMELRGTKFNIPLDVRTPSYTCAGDASQNNIPEMWSFDFWREYIDNLARYRYNLISLWNLHPFPSMVKVPDYPDVALNDVQRTTIETSKLNSYYHNHGTGLDAPEILANVEIVKNISIEEKIEFWRKVMSYAKERNIIFYVVTWNIFVNGTEGKYGITDDIDNEITRDYLKKSVKQMFVTYPDLAGIGLTTGENMPGATVEDKENWAFETYGKGTMETAEESPDRKITFLHRMHQAGSKAIVQKFEPLIDNKNIEFLFSFKYAYAHVYSATVQPYHESYIKDIEGKPKSTIWTMRNDDVYYFRWGAPDFVREFIKNIPYDESRGFYYGSDGWIWGRDFLAKESENRGQLEIVKHWYHWMIWGRLGYNPNLENKRFIQILQKHFPEVEAELLFTAWQEASMIYPTTTGFHWGPADYTWYIEGCISQPVPAQTETGFHDVNRFISLPPHPKSGYQSIPDFVIMKIAGDTSDLVSPFDVAQKLHSLSDNALKILEELKSGNNKELQVTLHDIRTIAYLGKYYAYKIEGSAKLALYRETKEKAYQNDAVAQLNSALEFWKKYTETALEQNVNPIWLNRVGQVDWLKITEWVEQDIEIAKL